jgi:hypothetical protein
MKWTLVEKTFAFLAVFGILACAPTALLAQSAPITLICTPQVGQGDPVQLILDENRGTALFSKEPSATATFNDTTVWWEIDSQDPNYQISYEHQYNLSRLTGVLIYSVVRGITDESGNVTWNREAGILYNCKIGAPAKLF